MVIDSQAQWGFHANSSPLVIILFLPFFWGIRIKYELRALLLADRLRVAQGCCIPVVLPDSFAKKIGRFFGSLTGKRKPV